MFNNTGNDNSISTPKLKYCVAPHIQNVSERVARILKQFHILLSHRPSFKIKIKLGNCKDIREPPYQAGVIYKMCCNNCDAVYIGETGRLLKDRTEEHCKDVKSKVTSNVYLHVLSTGRSFNFNDASVIGKSNNVRIRRKLEESTLLRLLTPPIELGRFIPYISLLFNSGYIFL